MFWQKLFREQDGFTLAEILVAVAILAVIGVGYISATDASTRGSRVAGEQIMARNIADTYLEVIRSSSFATNYDSVTANISVPFQYDVNLELMYSDDAETWTSNSSGMYLQRILISVSREGKPVLRLCSYKMQ